MVASEVVPSNLNGRVAVILLLFLSHTKTQHGTSPSCDQLGRLSPASWRAPPAWPAVQVILRHSRHQRTLKSRPSSVRCRTYWSCDFLKQWWYSVWIPRDAIVIAPRTSYRHCCPQECSCMPRAWRLRPGLLRGVPLTAIFLAASEQIPWRLWRILK